MKRSQGRTGYWFPLALFAVVVLAATGFYWQHFPGCPASQRVCAVPIAYVSRISSWSFLGSGLTPLFQPNSAALYWLIAIPLALVLCGVFFWRQQRRGGARVRILPAVITTRDALGHRSVVQQHSVICFGDLTVRGLVALLFIGAGIAVLAIVERTVSLGAFAASFLALVLLANLYDISNVIGFGSSPQAAELPNVVLPGLLLLLVQSHSDYRISADVVATQLQGDRFGEVISSGTHIHVRCQLRWVGLPYHHHGNCVDGFEVVEFGECDRTVTDIKDGDKVATVSAFLDRYPACRARSSDRPAPTRRNCSLARREPSAVVAANFGLGKRPHNGRSGEGES